MYLFQIMLCLSKWKLNSITASSKSIDLLGLMKANRLSIWIWNSDDRRLFSSNCLITPHHIKRSKRQKWSVLKNTESEYNNLTPSLNSQGIEYSRIMFCVQVDFLEFRWIAFSEIYRSECDQSIGYDNVFPWKQSRIQQNRRRHIIKHFTPGGIQPFYKIYFLII